MLLEVGRVARPHGLQGEVVVVLVTTRDERLAPGSALECAGRELVVESSQPVPGPAGPTGGRWLVRFAGIDSREAAESLAGSVLRAEPAADGGGRVLRSRADRRRRGRAVRAEPGHGGGGRGQPG